MNSRLIKILDTTLRDGEQSPGCSMNIHEKLDMAKQLERLGVDSIEAGFPIASPDDFASVAAIAKVIKNSQVVAFARATTKDIQIAYDAVKEAVSPSIHTFIATSDIHMKHKLKMTSEQVLECTENTIKFAKSLCDNIEFSAEDASRSDREFLLKIYNTAIKAGATTINIPDTVGYSTPMEMFELVKYIKENIYNPDVIVSVHCHDDLGMGVANTLMSIRAGASQVECTVNGIGERAGNAALEEIVMALNTRRDLYNAHTNINTKQIYRSTKLLSTITGIPVSPNKAIVGANAFAHEAGIHQHGILSERATYEIMSPEDIGIYQTKMVLGKHSGKHAFADRIKEIGYNISAEDIGAAFEKFKVLADRKKSITDRDLEALVGASGFEIPETYSLHSFVVNSGSIISATAVVKLLKDGVVEHEHVARGDGPIDAAFKAIDRIVKADVALENYTIQSVTEGEDALGEVVVKIKSKNSSITGRGLSTDIIEASIKAYINALNKAIIN